MPDQPTPLSPTEARKHIADLLTTLAKDADTSTLRGHFHNRGYPHLDEAALAGLRQLISTAAVAVTWPDQTTTGNAAPRTGMPLSVWLDRTERAQLDYRAAEAEQERDDALDDRDEYREARDVAQQLAAFRQGVIDRHRQELGAAGEVIAVVRDAVERIDRALAAYDTEPTQEPEREDAPHEDPARLREQLAEAHADCARYATERDEARAALAAPLHTAAEHLRLLAEDHGIDSLGFGIGWAADALDAWAKNPDEQTPPPVLGSPHRAQEDELAPWIRRAIADPGSIAGFRRGPHWPEGHEGWAEQAETVAAWSTRAVLRVLAKDGRPHCERCSQVIRVNDLYDPPLPGVGLWEHKGDCPPVEEIRGEHGPEIPAEQLPAGAPVSSVIAISNKFARAAGGQPRYARAAGHPAGGDWVRLRTGAGRQYEGYRAATCPGDGVAGHQHDIRCVNEPS